MTQQQSDMADSIGLLRRRFKLAASDDSRCALSQVDLLAGLVLDIVGADLVALFYRPPESREALLMAVRGRDGTAGMNLARLEKTHRRGHQTPGPGRLERVTPSDRDDFAVACGFTWRYGRAYEAVDGAVLTVAAYLNGPTVAVSEADERQVTVGLPIGDRVDRAVEAAFSVQGVHAPSLGPARGL